ncbi:MAG: type II secretion system F family protein [Deltaproteobacteria bacterium]|nr:type II secretion system F family protein [Deltaproteobacteria bacterium]
MDRLLALTQGIPNLLIIFTFLFFLCLVEGIFLVFCNADRQHKKRLQKRLKYLEGLEKRLTQESLLKAEVFGSQPWLRQALKKIRRLEQIQTLLLQADVNLPLGMMLLLWLLSGAVGLSLGFFRFGPPGGLLGFLLGMFLPYKILKMKKKHRNKKFEKQLPEALDLLARGLKAGHAFAAGLQMVGEEMPNPIGLEFFKTFKEYNHGMDMSTALLNLCHRMDLKELRFFTTAVLIQRETGGNLTEILEKIAGLIRERFKLRNQIKALTAEGRLSGWILILMPPALFLVMLRLNPEYTLMLVNHKTGRMMAMTAMFFQMLGMLTIRKIVNIKV